MGERFEELCDKGREAFVAARYLPSVDTKRHVVTWNSIPVVVRSLLEVTPPGTVRAILEELGGEAMAPDSSFFLEAELNPDDDERARYIVVSAVSAALRARDEALADEEESRYESFTRFVASLPNNPFVRPPGEPPRKELHHIPAIILDGAAQRNNDQAYDLQTQRLTETQ